MFIRYLKNPYVVLVTYCPNNTVHCQLSVVRLCALGESTDLLFWGVFGLYLFGTGGCVSQ